jgi:hypothetical protein|tara:strand:+ start:121 stop:732 length:612 start_codon:yes stop_codon:yes gene_type:complete
MIYKVIKSAISRELADFVYSYFLMKRQVVKYFFDQKYISPYTRYLGTWADAQIPETYSHYADFAMETLLTKVKPILEKETGLQLVETYSYARIYKKGDELKRHKDRPSCETSCTLNLGGDEWPIFLEPSGEEGKEGVKVLLNPGDMLIYRGCDLEHWRDPFEGDNCGQVFLHYNDLNGKFAEQNKYDGRPFLGLPAWFNNQNQ